MGGGIIQLVARGIPDLYLTGDPQITYFKIVYRRYTEFAMMDHPIKILGDVNWGSTHMIKIPNIADKLNRVSVILDIPTPDIKMKDPIVETIIDVAKDYDIKLDPLYAFPTKKTLKDKISLDEIFNQSNINVNSLGSLITTKANELNTSYNARLDVLENILGTYSIDNTINNGKYIAFDINAINKYFTNLLGNQIGNQIDNQGYLILSLEKSAEIFNSPLSTVNLNETSFVYYNNISSINTNVNNLIKIYPRVLNGYMQIDKTTDFNTINNGKSHLILSISYLKQLKERNTYLNYIYQSIPHNAIDVINDANTKYNSYMNEIHNKLLFNNFSLNDMLSDSPLESGLYTFDIDIDIESAHIFDGIIDNDIDIANNDYESKLRSLIINNMKIPLPIDVIDKYDLVDNDSVFSRYDINENAIYDPNSNTNTGDTENTENTENGVWLLDMYDFDTFPETQNVLEISDGIININPYYLSSNQDDIGFSTYKLIRKFKPALSTYEISDNINNIELKKVNNINDGVITLAKVFKDFYTIPSIADTISIKNTENLINPDINASNIGDLHNMILAIYDDVTYNEKESKNYKLDNIELYNSVSIRDLILKKLLKDIIYVDQKKHNFILTKYARNQNNEYIINPDIIDIYSDTDTVNSEKDIIYNNSKYLLFSSQNQNINIDDHIQNISYTLYDLGLNYMTQITDPILSDVRYSNNKLINTDFTIYDDNTIIDNSEKLHKTTNTNPHKNNIFKTNYIYAGKRFESYDTKDTQASFLNKSQKDNRILFLDDLPFTYSDGYRTCVNREVEFYHVLNRLLNKVYDVTNSISNNEYEMTIYEYIMKNIMDMYDDPRNYIYTVSFRITVEYLEKYYSNLKIILAPTSIHDIVIKLKSLVIDNFNSLLKSQIYYIFSILKNSTYDDKLSTPIIINSDKSYTTYNTQQVIDTLDDLVSKNKITSIQRPKGDPLLLRARFYAGIDNIRPITCYSDMTNIANNNNTNIDKNINHFITKTDLNESYTNHLSKHSQIFKNDMTYYIQNIISENINYVYWRDLNHYMKIIVNDVNHDYNINTNNKISYYDDIAVINHLPLMITYYYGNYSQQIFNTYILNNNSESNIKIIDGIKYNLFDIINESELDVISSDIINSNIINSMFKYINTDTRIKPKCPFHSFIDNSSFVENIKNISKKILLKENNILENDICPQCFKACAFQELFKDVLHKTLLSPDDSISNLEQIIDQTISHEYRIIDDDVIKNTIDNSSSNLSNNGNTIFLDRPENVNYDYITKTYFHTTIDYVIHRIATIMFRYKNLLLYVANLSNNDFNSWVSKHQPNIDININVNEINRYNNFIVYINSLRSEIENRNIFSDQIDSYISLITHTDQNIDDFIMIKNVYDSLGTTTNTQYIQGLSYIFKNEKLIECVEDNKYLLRYQMYKGNISLWNLLQKHMIENYNKYVNSSLNPLIISVSSIIKPNNILTFIDTPYYRKNKTDILQDIKNRNLCPDIYNEIYGIFKGTVDDVFINDDGMIDYYRIKDRQINYVNSGIDELNNSIITNMLNYCRQIMIYYNMLISRYDKLSFIFEEIINAPINEDIHYFDMSQNIVSEYTKNVLNSIQNMKIYDMNHVLDLYRYTDSSRYYFTTNKIFNRNDNNDIRSSFTLGQIMSILKMLGMHAVDINYEKISDGLVISYNDNFNKYINSGNNYEPYINDSNITCSPLINNYVVDGIYNRVFYFLPTISNILYDHNYNVSVLKSIPNNIISTTYYDFNSIIERRYTECRTTSPLIYLKNKMMHAPENRFSHTNALSTWEINFHNNNSNNKHNELISLKNLYNAYIFIVGAKDYTDIISLFTNFINKFYNDSASLRSTYAKYISILTHFIDNVSRAFDIVSPILRKQLLVTLLTTEFGKLNTIMYDALILQKETLDKMLNEMKDIILLFPIPTSINVSNIINNTIVELQDIFTSSNKILMELDLGKIITDIKKNIDLITNKEVLTEYVFKNTEKINSFISEAETQFADSINALLIEINNTGIVFVKTETDSRVYTASKLYNFRNLQIYNGFRTYKDVLYLILIEIIKIISPSDISDKFIKSIDYNSSVDTFNTIIHNIRSVIDISHNSLSKLVNLKLYTDENISPYEGYNRYDLDKLILSKNIPLIHDRLTYNELKQKQREQILKTKEGKLIERTKDIRLKNEKNQRSLLRKYNDPLSEINNMNNMNSKSLLYMRPIYMDSEIYNSIINILNRVLPQHAWSRYLGYRLIEHISLIIDGQQIDMFDSDLLLQYHKLFSTIEHKRGDDIMLGNIPEMYTINNETKPSMRLYVQIPLFFGKDYGNSLSLISMLYADIQLCIKIRNFDEVFYLEKGAILSKPIKIKSHILGNYIYLTDDERKTCATSRSESIMERFDKIGSFVRTFKDIKYGVLTNDGYLDNVIRFPFHMHDPCKYMLWTIEAVYPDCHNSDHIFWDIHDYNIRDINTNSMTLNTLNIIDQMSIEFNGKNRENWKSESFYRLLHPYNKFVNSLDNGEGLYAYCLFPKLSQPSGATNLSNIEEVAINIKLTDKIFTLMKNNNIKIKFNVWYCSHNIFTTISGFGALLFFGK